LQFNISGIIGPALGGFVLPLTGANSVFALNAACFLLVILALRRCKRPSVPLERRSESFFESRSVETVIDHIRNAPGFQVVFARSFVFALFISAVPALMPVMGLKVLHLSSSNLGLLFTSVGTGSVVGALLIIPWLRARLSSDSLTLFANLLLVFVYASMAFVRAPEVFFFVAALAGVGWTLSASELWVAAQRAIPGCARGRLNAAIIMISQGAMALGGIIWGSIAAIAGADHALLGAAVLFLLTLFLTRRLSINAAGNFEETVSDLLPGKAEPDELTPIAIAEELLAA
jgi:predicted MFS family arabinose efflux permease